MWAADAFVRLDPGLDGGIAGAGARLPPRDGSFECTIAGRALHDEHGYAPLPSVRAVGAREVPAAGVTGLEAALIGEWSRRAEAEWASVPAFLQLADQLRRAGAPPALVTRALGAADDELRHAVSSARVVRHAGTPIDLGRVTPATRAPVEGGAALPRLAVESWVDGCLGEGTASAAAAREADGAHDRALRAMQRGIASDEARHAQLAWDVLDWTLHVGGDDVRHAVWTVRDAAPAEAAPTARDVDLAPVGVLSASAHRRVADRTREEACARLEALLG